VPTCSPECSGFVCSITTTTSIINKAAADTFRKPPSLASRQMSCPPLLLPKPPQLPDIEDVDEESTTVTPPPTSGDSKPTQSSFGSEDPGTEAVLMTSAIPPSPVLTEMLTVSKGQLRQLQLDLTSIEPIDDTISAFPPKPNNKAFMMDQGERLIASQETAEELENCQNQTDTCLDMSKMVASQSTLSSWSSTASVATRTNTDNPASLSHIVTNFNITQSAKAAVNQRQDTLAARNSASAADKVVFSTTKSASLTTTLSSTTTQMSQNLTLSKVNMTTAALLEHSTIASQHKLRLRQNQAPDSDDNKEYTPMKVFKQTPV